MTKGEVKPIIIKLALPIMGTSLLQFTYNLIDMLWIGGLGTNAVASIASSSFFLGIGYSINSLVVVGTGIKTSWAIGAKDKESLGQYVNAGNFINLILALFYGVFLIILGRGLIGFLNINNLEVEKDAFNYLIIAVPMMFFTFFNLLYTRILNSYGNNKDALKISALGLLLNLILDPILIYVLKLGVIGAALGSLVGNLVMFIIYIKSYKEIVGFNFTIGIKREKVLEIIKLGFPIAFQRVLFTVVNILLGRIVSIFGSEALAAQKIGLQIESVSFMIIGGLNGAIAAFTGQNYGGKNLKRIKDGYFGALKIGVVYSIILSIIFYCFSLPLSNLFIRDVITIEIASGYLKILALSQIFSAIEMISNGFYTGIGKPIIPSVISITFTVLRIPLSLLLIGYFGVTGIWLSIAITSILKGITSITLYFFKYKMKKLQ